MDLSNHYSREDTNPAGPPTPRQTQPSQLNLGSIGQGSTGISTPRNTQGAKSFIEELYNRSNLSKTDVGKNIFAHAQQRNVSNLDQSMDGSMIGLDPNSFGPIEFTKTPANSQIFPQPQTQPQPMQNPLLFGLNTEPVRNSPPQNAGTPMFNSTPTPFNQMNGNGPFRPAPQNDAFPPGFFPSQIQIQKININCQTYLFEMMVESFFRKKGKIALSDFETILAIREFYDFLGLPCPQDEVLVIVFKNVTPQYNRQVHIEEWKSICFALFNPSS